jgi:iron complex transport system substrate-binding protein
MGDPYPRRIVCLSDESTELLYLLGEQHRIVGVSGFTVRPAGVRKQKPIVSTFTDACLGTIGELEPDLVIGFSDVQAGIAQKLVAAGFTVWINNHRSVQGILDMMVQLGALVGKAAQALELVADAGQQIARIQAEVAQWPQRPLVYTEEWYEPLITGIQWVSELVELAGGVEAFPEYSRQPLAKDRVIADPAWVVARNPDILLASWCGKMFKKRRVLARPGWEQIKAIRCDEVYEIPSSIILQPGPASVMEGLPMLHEIFRNWVQKQQALAGE